MKEKRWSNTVCIDFDGVISEFGNDRAGQLVEGVLDGLTRLIEAGWYIEVFSGRSATIAGRRFMWEYFKVRLPELTSHIVSNRINFPSDKPIAKAYIDDRGITFTGWADITPELLESFRAWWQHPASHA